MTTNNPHIPSGWKLVPEKPSTLMLDAGIYVQGAACDVVYRTMLAAAPPPPAPSAAEQSDIERDAARYRWLRTREWAEWHIVHGGLKLGMVELWTRAYGDELDRLVDEAMEREGR